MTELDIIKRAKMYIDKLSHGVNPIDNTMVGESDVVNHERVSKCLCYVSEVLEKVIENGGFEKKHRVKKVPFEITDEQLAAFEYSDTPLRVTEITGRINALVDLEMMKNLKVTAVTEYLVDIDMLGVQRLQDGKTRKVPTENGRSLGIITEKRFAPSNGMEYTAVLYNRNAQEFILENLGGIIEKNNEKSSKQTDTLADD